MVALQSRPLTLIERSGLDTLLILGDPLRHDRLQALDALDIFGLLGDLGLGSLNLVLDLHDRVLRRLIGYLLRGVGLFLAYTRPPFVLYGTLWILLIAFVTIALPAAYQQLQSAFRVINPDLEEASRILGATRLGTLGRITAPLLRTSVIATWCFIFVGVIRELSAAIMLFTSETKVISVLIYDLNESGDLGAIAVLGILMLVFTFAVVVLINRIPVFGGVNLRNT